MGRTAIHLLPGLDGTGLLFQPLKKELSKYPDFDVQICNFPSDKNMSLNELTDHAISQIGEATSGIVVAESLSTLIILNAGKRLRAKGLVLCAPFCRPPRGIMIKAVRYVPAVILHYFAQKAPIIRNFCLDHQASEEIIALFRKTIEAVPSKVLKQRLVMTADSNIMEQMKDIDIPYCIIHPTRDRLVPSQHASIMDNMGIAPVHNVDAPHLVLQSAPSVCAEVIKDFTENLHH